MEKIELCDEQKKEIDELITWGVKENIPSEDLFIKLMELSLKYKDRHPVTEIDPSRTVKGYNPDTFEPIYED